jgi:hypothetical protein
MRQPFSLDPPRRGSYYALIVLGVLSGACVPPLKSIAPTDLRPVAPDTVARWTAEFQPAVRLAYELRWRFENQNGRAGGRATVRFAPPDTLRFDYRGPFGKSGSALLVGQEAQWAEPEGDFRNLIPVAPILWAALGIAVPASGGSELLGSASPTRRAWRYVDGDEAIDFIYQWAPEPRLLAELRRADEIVGVADVTLAARSRTPAEAVMRFPGDRSRFSFTVQGVDTVASFPPDTWRRP